ncbi:MAG TPA: tetratricopeptide repeat protein, partial [Bacteroidetes bacterium]|nr:tetratricopeptide repeat protein [Bacteroidota bacterium]
MNKAGLRNTIIRLLSIVFILFSIKTNTQAIDSIQSLIYETNSTEKKFELYEALFKIYSSNNELEKMLEIAEVQYALAIDYKDILLEAKALRNIANTAYSLNRFKLAEVKFEKALAAFNKFKDYHNEKASVLNNLANLKSRMGDYISGLDYYHQAYDVLLSSKENKRKKQIAIILLNLGVTYSDVGLTDDALLYYEKALSMFQKENNLKLVVFCLNNIGSIYLSQKQYKKALFTFEGNEKKISELKDESQYEGLYKLNLGVAYWHNGQKKKGLKYMEFGKAFYEKRNDEVSSLGCDLEIAKVKLLEGSLKEARDLMYKSYKKSIEIGLAEETKKTSEGLQKIYKQLGILDSAYKYQHIYINLKDSLSGEEMRSKLIKLSLNDKFKKADQLRQTQHEAEMNEQKFINWFIIIFSFLIMIFSGFIYVIYRDKRKSHIIITKQKEAIVDSLNYAQRIQSAILISEEQLKKLWKELFVFLKPRDLVSGDFYWIHKTEEHIMFAVVDCVGHGVPGAFMTMIGNTLLNDIVIERDIKEPGEILKELHKGVVKGLRQEKDSKAVD